jgi:putative transposase
MDATELARSKAIEDENARMRRIISNLTLENDAMKTLLLSYAVWKSLS